MSLSFVMGLASKRSMKSPSFTNWLGQDQESWAISHRGVLWHNKERRSYFTEPFRTGKSLKVGFLFSPVKKTLTIFRENQMIGVAFRDIQSDHELYPTFVVSGKNVRVAMTAWRPHETLKDWCRTSILRNLNQPKCHMCIEKLNLPRSLINYVFNRFPF